jgi:hypothetical protein
MCVLIRTKHVEVRRSKVGVQAVEVALKQSIGGLRTAQKRKRFGDLRTSRADRIRA